MLRLDWIDISVRTPRIGQNVIAVGTWCGEICHEGEDDFMGIGEWNGECVNMDTDTYCTDIVRVTFWHPLPEHP